MGKYVVILHLFNAAEECELLDIRRCSVCISIYTHSHEHNNITVSSDI